MKRTISDETILEAALTVFAEKGYTGATTRQIAQQADINEVTLFRRFGNKQKLLVAVLENEARGFGADEIVYTGDLEHDLSQIVGFYQRLMRERFKVMLIMLSELSRQPELKTIFQAVMGNVERFMLIVMRYQEEGRLVPEPPLQALIALLSPLFMTQMLVMANPAAAQLQSEPEMLVAQFLTGRRPRDR